MNWTEIGEAFFEFAGKYDSVVGALLGAYLGWKLSWKSQRNQRSLDFLRDKIKALRNIKIELENSLPALSGEELLEKINTDSSLSKHALVRLFGLRNELIPDIEPELVKLIDNKLSPLYDRSKRGEFALLPDKRKEFTIVVEELRLKISELESKYRKEYVRHCK